MGCRFGGILAGHGSHAVATLDALCFFCELRASIRRLATEDGPGRWEVRALSPTGVESWQVEADELIEVVCLLAEQLGFELGE